MSDSVIGACAGLKSAVSGGGASAPNEYPTLDDFVKKTMEDMPYSNEPSDGSLLDMGLGMKKKRGRPSGKKPGKSPSATDAEITQKMITHMNAVSDNSADSVLARRRISKYLDCFQHRLRHHFPQRPMLSQLTSAQLAEMESTITNILDEGDEAVYVKEAFVAGAGFIESAGPVIQRRFLRWLPNSAFLANQDGLQEAVKELVDVQGDEGLADEVNRVAISFTGYAPSNPYMKAAMKVVKLMQAVSAAQQAIIVQQPMQSGSSKSQINGL